MPETSKTVTACLLIIGNEILSGRTKDANLQFLALELNKLGVRLMEVRVIPERDPYFVIEEEMVREGIGMFDRISTRGASEIVVESPDHGMTLHSADEAQIERVLSLIKHEVGVVPDFAFGIRSARRRRGTAIRLRPAVRSSRPPTARKPMCCSATGQRRGRS